MFCEKIDLWEWEPLNVVLEMDKNTQTLNIILFEKVQKHSTTKHVFRKYKYAKSLNRIWEKSQKFSTN